jgi:hypothetical protein
MVGPAMPDRSKGRGQTKCSPPGWGLAVVLTKPNPEKSTVTKPQSRPRPPHRDVAPVNNNNNNNNNNNTFPPTVMG